MVGNNISIHLKSSIDLKDTLDGYNGPQYVF